MDSTAEILKKMDGTAFEKFCGPVLRKKVPDLANFIPSGINEAGKTIKSLMDGFCFIGSNYMATVHITTINEKDLPTKWLYDGDALTVPKGDLIKGINQAREIHAQSPHFKFSIFLVHNKRVDDALHLKVHQRNTDSFISITIIELENLVSFLDFEPEGQYLRQKLLGINADRISESLLREIAYENLAGYGKEIYLEEEHLANVSGVENVEQQLADSTNRINLLRGESGLGKSSSCFALMRSTLERGQMALRIRPSIIEKALSPEDAVLQQLVTDYPRLYIQLPAIQLLFENALVIIDDINKSPDTTTLLDKIISWNETKSAKSFIILCPVWPRNLAALDNKAKKVDKYTAITLLRLSFYDCRQIIERRTNSGLVSLTDQQIHSLIIDTGFDPLLLDFSLQLLADQPAYSDRIANDAIAQFVDDKIQLTHHSTQTPVHFIIKTLILFGGEMLKKRKLAPHLDDIKGWIGKESEEFRIVCAIAAQRQLFAFDDQGHCHFRHDRVLEHLLAMAGTELLNDFTANEYVLTDPFYAEIIGASLASTTINKDLLETLVTASPLAVFSSLKFLQDHHDGSMLAKTVEVCESWSITIAIKHVPKGITDSIANLLINFDVKDIERVTKGFPNSAELQLAKFRNGIWVSGIMFLTLMEYFYPESPNYWWNSILAHVKSKHLKSVIDGLRSILPQSFTVEAIAHAYTLAGFLREPQLLESLAHSWKKYASPEHYVGYLWAVLNSFTAKDKETVAATLSYFNTLSDKQKHQSTNSKRPLASIIHEIERAGWDFSDEQLALLIELSSDSSLHPALVLLFAHIDHPKALAIVLDKEMQRDGTHYSHGHEDERWDISKKWPKLSQASRDYLLQEFSNTTNHAMRRYVAWRFWTGNVETTTVLQKMQEFNSEIDSLYDHAVLWRINNHDQTAFNAFKHCIARKPWLIRTLDDVWNEEAANFFSEWFELQIGNKNKEQIRYGLELLEMLDNDFAVQIIVRHWERLKSYWRGISLALFLSTPETKALADKEIKKLGFEPGQPMPDFYYRNAHGVYWSQGDGLSDEKKAELLLLSKLFTRLHRHFGVKYVGKSERLTRKKVETLLPYLELMDSYTLLEFANRCLQISASDLCFEKFYPLLGRHERKRIRLTTEDIKWDLIGKLRELEREDKVYISHWIDDADKLGVSNEMLGEAVQLFLAEHKSAKAFFIIALVFERLGTRNEIEIMNQFIPNSEEDVRNVAFWKENASFLIKRRSLH